MQQGQERRDLKMGHYDLDSAPKQGKIILLVLVNLYSSRRLIMEDESNYLFIELSSVCLLCQKTGQEKDVLPPLGGKPKR